MKANRLIDRWKTEPGKTILGRLNLFFEGCTTFDHGKTSEGVFALLNGLPYREEVSSGKDLRGIGAGIVCQLDFRNTDFSYAELTNFIACDFSGAMFDDADLHGVHLLKAAEASFRRAKMRECNLVRAQVKRCDFEAADLYHARCREADFQGSSFLSAKCKGTDFCRANLRDCNFRRADLTDALIAEASLDKTTDFRGACLINIQQDEQRDIYGKVLFRAGDWRQATWDAATIHGTDPSLHALELLEETTKFLAEDPDETAKVVLDIVRRAMAQIKTKFDKRWYEKILSQLSDEQETKFEQAADLASRSLM